MNFTDRPQGGVWAYMPPKLRAYLELARLDRPIGIWLLLFPCLWSLALAGSRDWTLYAIFAIGAAVMRGAGCTLNDIIDRRIDAEVQRTKGRPLPSGRIRLSEAFVFLAGELGIGLVILLQLNRVAVQGGIASLALVAVYPFMKRLTWWPQAFLGLTFNWGALMGWAAATGHIAAPAYVLYAGGIAWTLAYDTIYAHQDKRDDQRIGIKSTARRLGDGKTAVSLFYASAFLLIAVAGSLSLGDGIRAYSLSFYLGLAVTALYTMLLMIRWQPDRPENCLTAFKANRWIGLLIFAAIVIGLPCYK